MSIKSNLPDCRTISLAILVTLVSTSAQEKMNSNTTIDMDKPSVYWYANSPIELGRSPDKTKNTASGPTQMSTNTTLENQDHPPTSHFRLAANIDLRRRQHQKKIRYLLRSESGKWEELHRSGYDATLNGRWDPKAKVKVVIHGYSPPDHNNMKDVFQDLLMFKIGDAYGASGTKYNIIVVDWTSLSTESLYRYQEAAISATYAGEDVAEFLSKLKSRQLISSWEDVHIIGHSIGAHAAGVAGTAIEQLSGGFKIGRITGLDPAGHVFQNNVVILLNQLRALRKSDAKFVDVIHCNMARTHSYTFDPRRLGTALLSGHADFYPDGGEKQRNCSVLKEFFKSCSHFKCILFFAQSVSEYYLSCPCQNWENFQSGKCPCKRNDGFGMAMGEQCSSRARGKYYRYMQ